VLLSNAYKLCGGTSWKMTKLKTEKGITTVRKEFREGGRWMDLNSCPKQPLILTVLTLEFVLPESL
jgi:hypothetical protein